MSTAKKEMLSRSDRREDLYELGLVYEKEKDYTNALRYITAAAEHDLPDAQNELGDIYLFEKGIKQNRDQAFKWYTKAAEQGSAHALANLGFRGSNQESPKSAIQLFFV
jgi:uncharacterized protein